MWSYGEGRYKQQKRGDIERTHIRNCWGTYFKVKLLYILSQGCNLEANNSAERVQKS